MLVLCLIVSLFYMHAWCLQRLERVSDPQKIETQIVFWVWGITLRSYGRATIALNHFGIFLAPRFISIFKYVYACESIVFTL